MDIERLKRIREAAEKRINQGQLQPHNYWQAGYLQALEDSHMLKVEQKIQELESWLGIE